MGARPAQRIEAHLPRHDVAAAVAQAQGRGRVVHLDVGVAAERLDPARAPGPAARIHLDGVQLEVGRIALSIAQQPPAPARRLHDFAQVGVAPHVGRKLGPKPNDRVQVLALPAEIAGRVEANQRVVQRQRRLARAAAVASPGKVVAAVPRSRMLSKVSYLNCRLSPNTQGVPLAVEPIVFCIIAKTILRIGSTISKNTASPGKANRCG